MPLERSGRQKTEHMSCTMVQLAVNEMRPRKKEDERVSDSKYLSEQESISDSQVT